MLKRRAFICRVAAGLLGGPLAVRAQKTPKVYRIGILETIPAAQNTANVEALRKGLRELGYVEGLVIGIVSLTQLHHQAIVDLAARNGLPAVYPAREFAEAGGLLAYGVNYPDLYFRFARFVDKIFKGAKPGELPVEQPTKFELIINFKTAKALGITIPQSVLLRSDEIIR